ncbi:hypothetical protein [Kitasatospora sp. NPDC006786]|uniref:hypothetical protein n=1 Tax=unclassified Kitasatospora TaxID=2633591 RepID=UPI0033C37722
MESPTRAIKDDDQDDDQAAAGAHCGWCEQPIRSTGAGQRPGYCPGRSCSAKAYRRRTKAREEAALAAAADATREPASAYGSEAAEQIARLGLLAERTARRLAADLDAGVDPMHLRVSLAALTRAAEDLLARARTTVRQAEAQRAAQAAGPGLDATREASSGGSGVPGQRPDLPAPSAPAGPGPAAPSPAPAPRPTAYGPARTEAAREPSRDSGPAVREAPDPAPPVPPMGWEERDTIANTTAPDAAGRIARHIPPSTPPAVQPTPLPPRLALDTRIAALAPYGLGDPDQRADLGVGLTLHGWSDWPRVARVDRADQMIAWVEEGVSGWTGWAALVDGRLVIDAADRQPLLAPTRQGAADLLLLALRQGLVR